VCVLIFKQHQMAEAEASSCSGTRFCWSVNMAFESSRLLRRCRENNPSPTPRRLPRL